MKYWKGKTGTTKAGLYGTAPNGAIVPDTDDCTQIEYDNWVATLPAIVLPIEYQSIKDVYLQAISDLQAIQNVASPTNAQVVWAIKREAEIMETLLKFIKKAFTVALE